MIEYNITIYPLNIILQKKFKLKSLNKNIYTMFIPSYSDKSKSSYYIKFWFYLKNKTNYRYC